MNEASGFCAVTRASSAFSVPAAAACSSCKRALLCSAWMRCSCCVQCVPRLLWPMLCERAGYSEYSQGYSEYSHGFRSACAVWKHNGRGVLAGVLRVLTRVPLCMRGLETHRTQCTHRGTLSTHRGTPSTHNGYSEY